MAYFHTDSHSTVEYLSHVMANAARYGYSVRLDTTDTGDLRVKVGGGAWINLDGTFDMSREVPLPVPAPVL